MDTRVIGIICQLQGIKPRVLEKIQDDSLKQLILAC